ncbi:hypothetical protein FKG94_03445 [Exilibacterium tricleocarpae]|uniref:Uncharacterized protein n=1 Tax=Exilibacterium tricleocarpae TaxID=2591008 RepID=A0A545U714_9GAMM|nr:YdbH domain-containing protein [Exilibacterium tricleocarpae]TQV85252.1 hypothetical protein FKG94_03445 [Exilibacterium tricleocarpae]
MKKQVTIASLIFIGLIFVALILLLALRQTVAKLAVETALADTSLTLEQLQGLELHWEYARLEELALRPDNFPEPIRLRGIEARFSLPDGRLETITIDHLWLPSEAGGQTATDAEAPLLVSDLIRTLHELPLQGLNVTRITWGQQPVAEQLQWRRSNDGQQLRARHHNFLLTLALQTTAAPGAAAELGGQLQLRRDNDELLLSTFDLEYTAAGYLSQITLTVMQEDWNEALDSLRHPFPAVAAVSDARGKLDLSLHTTIADNLDTALQDGLEITLTPALDINLGYTDATLPVPAFATRVEVNRPITLSARQEDVLSLAIDIPALQISASAPGDRVTSALHLDNIHCRYRQTVDCSGNLDLAFSATEFTVHDFTAQSITGGTRGTLTIIGNNIDTTVTSTELLQAQQLRHRDVVVSDLALSAPSALHISFDAATSAVALNADRLQLDLTDLTQAGNTLTSKLILDDLQLNQAETLAFEAGFSASPIVVDIPDHALPRFAVDGNIAARDNRLTLAASLNSDTARPLIAIEVDHHLLKQTGSAELRSATIPFDQKANKLSRHFSRWPLQLDILAGDWTMNGQLAWRQADADWHLTGRLDQQLGKLAGYYKDYAFTDLDSTLAAQLTAAGPWVSVKPAQVDIGLLDIGLPVTDLAARFSFDSGSPQLEVHRLQAALLGGQVSTADIVYRPGQGDTNAVVAIDNIDLGELVRLTASEDISASGKVSGKLPFVIGPDGLRMEQGQLGALQPGGVLAYHPDPQTLQAIAENPTTKFAYDVLSNYHYSTLDTQIRYQPDGWMVLANRMYGVNPDLNNGQPIKLNPKIEVNALDTLRSLRVSRTVSDFFENQLGNP